MTGGRGSGYQMRAEATRAPAFKVRDGQLTNRRHKGLADWMELQQNPFSSSPGYDNLSFAVETPWAAATAAEQPVLSLR
eukprot:764642-Hanusia_phi.AAC.1